MWWLRRATSGRKQYSSISYIYVIEVLKDKFGNLYVVKGKAEVYSCFVSHIDQVSHCKYSKDFKAVEIREDIFGYSPKNRRFENLGADDQNGVFLCLECLKKYDSMKVVFFRHSYLLQQQGLHVLFHWYI